MARYESIPCVQRGDTRPHLRRMFSCFQANLTEYTEDIQAMVDSVVESTIAIYNECLGSLLPTPDKSHYTFNLRDLSSVFQGMLSADARKCETVEKFSALWIHENRRVFKDRLVNDNDR